MNADATIPGPKGRFFTGHLKEARERPLAFMLEVARDYGDVVQLRVGPLRFVMIRHPDHVKRVLQERAAAYGRPAFVSMVRRLVGNGLLFSEGDTWLRQRRTMQPAFHRERIVGFAKTMGDAVSARVDAWRRRGSDAPIDVSREMQRLSFEIVGRTLFSTDLSADASELGVAIRFLLKWLDDRTVSPAAAPLFVPTPDNLRFKRGQRLFAETIARIVAEHRAAADGGPSDLLAMLLAARDPETGEGMPDAQVRDEVLTFLIAGYETTSAALEWTLWLLARHPAVQDRVRAEQREVCGDRPPRPEELASMPVTRAVIDESLRLYPPVYGLSRRALEDDELGGYRIPKGVQVLVSPWLTHRDPALWPSPDVFDPDRFAPERAKERHRFAHFPFGGGPRQCIGNAFAMMELQILIPTLVGALRFELADGADATPEPRSTLHPRGPLLMHVRA